MSKTIEQVMETFRFTDRNKWKQHKNGLGWVYETAIVEDSAYVSGIVSGNAQVYGNAQVSGDARVSGNAQVYGNAQVSGDARVSGNAQVYGNAQVSGDARVSGNAWEKSPLYIQGSRHAMTLCSFTAIAIGCHVHKIAEWTKNYKKIGKAENYSPAEIKEYGEYIVLMSRSVRELKSKTS